MLINQTIGQFILMVDQDLIIDAGATSTQTPEQPRIQALFLTHQHLDPPSLWAGQDRELLGIRDEGDPQIAKSPSAEWQSLPEFHPKSLLGGDPDTVDCFGAGEVEVLPRASLFILSPKCGSIKEGSTFVLYIEMVA